MELDEFEIGKDFECSGKTYRCTDIGSRSVVAIRVDRVETQTRHEDTTTRRVLDRWRADAEGWFRGPPYAILEMVFDEEDLELCTLAT
ncbi:hypothetical protein [Mesorhizobium sp. SP-1A]|uniref:hypothetical protein n=1 Tax=Mesorhizobium sp. SP-1A TaxID=3077840 RepID=UPI0028F6F9C6|nr:hypothetical protein [Mesorhizobium sp. SP-1A]